jgi:hypothetical protein
VLFSLFETLVDVQDQFDSMLTNLFLLFDQMIVDPESFQVRLYTLRSLGKVAECIEVDKKEDIRAFQELVPKMVHVLQQALTDCDEDSASKGFEVFDCMLYLVSLG